jgi:hypothetical protein
MYLLRFVGCGFAVLLLSLATWVSAVAADDLAVADDLAADFADQGEYASGIRGADASTGPAYGLQLVALGDGRFSARLFPGGLPGNGGRASESVALEGTREDGQVIVREGNQHITIRDHKAVLRDAADQELATLVKVVRRSPLLGVPAPDGAIVLFDGQATAAFKQARVSDGLLQVGTELIPRFRNYLLHVEFQVPFVPIARGQGRGNSGLYLQSRYEVQVLDSFGLDAANNECGALYRQRAPDINMSFPALAWQTFDITFHSPIYDRCGRKRRDARISVLHNGVLVHDRVAIHNKTGAGQPEGPELLPIKFQDHGNPVQFRNIWLRELR